MTHYIMVKCDNCGHIKRVNAEKANAEPSRPRMAIFKNEAAPFLSEEHGTLRLVTPDIFKLGLEPFWKAVAVTFPSTVIIGCVSLVHFMTKYADPQKLNQVVDIIMHAFVPIITGAVVFPVTLKKTSEFWTWSQPQPTEPQDKLAEDETEQELDYDLPHIERETDHEPCWEYTVQVGRERQLRRYYPPQYRDSRGRMHYVDIPDLRRFALEIVRRRFEWVDATRDATMRLNRAQYVAIREDWQGQGWIENLPNRQKQVVEQAPIHMIAEREPR